MQFSERLMQQLGMSTCALIERDVGHVPPNTVRPGFPWGRKSAPAAVDNSLTLRLRRRISRLDEEVRQLSAENQALKNDRLPPEFSEGESLGDELWECRGGLLHAALLLQSVPEETFQALMAHDSYAPFMNSLRFTRGDFTGGDR